MKITASMELGRILELFTCLEVCGESNKHGCNVVVIV